MLNHVNIITVPKVVLVISILLSFFSEVLGVGKALAVTEFGENQFITIVNPVRISAYNPDPKLSLEAEYKEIRERNLPATWLLTSDVLEMEDLVGVIKGMDRNQELGIFLEVTPSSARKSNVSYYQTDSWHRASSLFLVGYQQQERRILIDSVFERFKAIFGYYPKSVGAWWVDSYSLQYMKEKYGIIANLGCSDQFLTDGYSIWGQPWSIPYYPSRFHAGMPARTLESKLDIVTLQWAPRDPINGYGDGRASTYSTQDYQINNLSIDYFANLVKLYVQKQRNLFGQVTLGLEADLSASVYSGLYGQHLDIIKKLQNEGVAEIVTMEKFSSWYRKEFPVLSPPHLIETDDLLGKRMKGLWYQSPNYRIGLIYEYDKEVTRLIDFRTYHDNFQEPFYVTPNRQNDLYINIPSVIDVVSLPESTWIFPLKQLVSIEGSRGNFSLRYESNQSINIEPAKVVLQNIDLKIPKMVTEAMTIKINNLAKTQEIVPAQSWPVGLEGLIIKDYPPQVLYLLDFNNLKQPKNVIRICLTFLFIGGIIFMTFRLRIVKRVHLTRLVLIILVISTLTVVLTRNYSYFISQAEVDALQKLQGLPEGKVVVYDHYCLRCPFHSTYLPRAFINRKDYVKNIGGKQVIYNRSVFEAVDKTRGRQELLSLGVRYVYLIKQEDYWEKLPFSFQDYGLKKLYENANAQIWEVR
ncbi:hypothetical protein C4577_00430 [Candidatus Parcubacteria bacterium]|nr:MAG: hypothetical protein C4577_00430 [Candidatus Parcubacteria bacterium]